MRNFNLRDYIYFIFSILSVVPFVAIEHPPITDMPAHISRLFILCRPELYEGMYQVELSFIPNLAMDLLWLPICGLMEPSNFIRGLTALSLMVIFTLGWMVRRRLHGRIDFTLFLLPAMAMNVVSVMGYTNFLLSIVVLILMVLLLVARPNLSWVALSLATTALGAAAYVSHIFGLVLLMAMTGCWVWMNRFAAGKVSSFFKAVAVSLLLFAVPIGMILFGFGGTENQGNIHYSHIYRTVMAPVMSGAPVAEFFIGLLLLVSLIHAFAKRALVIPTGWKMAVSAGLAMSLLLPSYALGGYDIGTRLMVPTLMIIIALARVDLGQRALWPLRIAIGGIFIFHAWAFLSIWRPFDMQIAEMRRAANVIERGAPLLSIVETKGPQMATGSSFNYIHLASYIEADRKAFDPLGFNGTGMQPISVAPAYQLFDIALGTPLTSEDMMELLNLTGIEIERLDFHEQYMANWDNRFPYILYLHHGKTNAKVLENYEIIEKGDFFWILRTKNKALLHESYGIRR